MKTPDPARQHPGRTGLGPQGVVAGPLVLVPESPKSPSVLETHPRNRYNRVSLNLGILSVFLALDRLLRNASVVCLFIFFHLPF